MCLGITLFRLLLHHTLNKGHGGIKIEYLHLIASQYSLTMEEKLLISNSNKRKIADEDSGDNNTPEKRKKGKITPSFCIVLRIYKIKADVTRYLFKSLLYTGIDKNLDSTSNNNYCRLSLPLISTDDLEIIREEIGKRNTHFRQMKNNRRKRASLPTSYNITPNLAALSAKLINYFQLSLDLTTDDGEVKEETKPPKRKKKVTRPEAAKKKRSARSFKRLCERNLALNQKVENKLYVEVVSTNGTTSETDRHKVLQHLATNLSYGVDEVVRPDPLELVGVTMKEEAIWVKVPNKPTQDRVIGYLTDLVGYTATARTFIPKRRYSLGVPGYLVEIEPARMINCLIVQNKGFPKGGLKYISTHIDKDTNAHRPTVFVDVTKEAEEWLKDHSFVVKIFTSPIGLWRVSGKNESV